MCGYAYLKCISGIQNYNFAYKNPFAYFTQACFNAFRSTLSKYYKQINIRKAVTEKIICELENSLPGSSIQKCLDKQFNGEYGGDDDYGD